MSEIPPRERKIIAYLHHLFILFLELVYAIPVEGHFSIEEGFTFKFLKLDKTQRKLLQEAISIIELILHTLDYETESKITENEVKLAWRKRRT